MAARQEAADRTAGRVTHMSERRPGGWIEWNTRDSQADDISVGGHMSNETMPEWVFDPVPPSGALSGGDPTSYVFSPDIDTLVREVVQNATDQQSGDAPVKVVFSLHELTDDARDSFLDALGWSVLREHLVGVANSASLINGRVRDALAEIDGGRLLVLQIEDSGTRGLTGDEDGTSGNFAALCKHVLVTNDEKAARGGSYGLGKAVLWRFSALSTVLFGSTFMNQGAPDRRVFGRTEQPFHDAEGVQWSGPGWFGTPEVRVGGSRAVSVRGSDADSIATDLLVARNDETGHGTTALIVGFAEPSYELNRPVAEIAKDIVDAAARWFWPRLADGSLEVHARGLSGGDIVLDEIADTSLADPGYVAAALQPVTGATAETEGQLAERELELRIPRLRSETLAGEIEGNVTLRLIRVGGDDDGATASGVALVRGAGMVVKHWRIPGIPLQSGGYRAVLLAGTRHGAEPSDQAIEEFLRAAEPPEHHEWVHHTNALKSRYRPGAKARLDELWTKIRTATLEICSSKAGQQRGRPSAVGQVLPDGGHHRQQGRCPPIPRRLRQDDLRRDLVGGGGPRPTHPRGTRVGGRHRLQARG